MTRTSWPSLTAAILILLLCAAALQSAADPRLATSPAVSIGPVVKWASEQAQGGQVAAVDCSQLDRLGIDKQMNVRAYQLMADCGRGGTGNGNGNASSTGGYGGESVGSSLLNPPALGGVDRDVILPEGDFPHVTQSEAMIWAHGQTVVVNFNDSRAQPTCYAGISYSTDGGTTWTRVNGGGLSPICTGHGTNLGDPVVVYNQALGKWFAGDIAVECGGQGLGLWTSTDGITWTPGACAHVGPLDDRESMWVDNNPASPHFGRMYISYNNFSMGSGAINLIHSDDGVTWSAPVQLSNGFIRDVQVTGDLLGGGNVYVAGMDEGSGGLSARQNIIYRSTDGGATWAGINVGTPLPAPGRIPCASDTFFVCMFSPNGGYWRYQGWGQPAAVGNTVVYDYTQHGTGADTGDVYVVRSTDAGLTWGAPVKLNTDGTQGMQWQPSLAATVGGAVYAGWYDQREVGGVDCAPGSSNPCYRRWGRLSLDGGATWQPDEMVGDVISPLPAQPDTGIQPAYAGDYDYISADGTNIYDHWTDGRVVISNNAQQDLFLDKISAVVGSPTPAVTGTPPTAAPTNTPNVTPTPCGPNANYSITRSMGATIVPGTNDTGSNCDDCDTGVALPFPVSVYGQSYTGALLSSNGRIDLVTAHDPGAFDNSCLLVAGFDYVIFPHWDDMYTLHTAPGCSAYPNGQCGIFTSVSGTAPNRIFNIEWRAVPSRAGAPINFEVRFYESPVNEEFDIIYGTVFDSGNSATVGIEGESTNFQYSQFECNTGGLTQGLMLAFTLPACGTPAATPTGAGTTPTGTPSATRTTPAGTSTAATNTPTHAPASTTSVLPSETAARPTSTAPPETATGTTTAATTATATGTPCNVSFSDVHTTDYFYNAVIYLACRGVIGGYPDNTFRPYKDTTRGQVIKIVVLGFNKPAIVPPGGEHMFADVLPDNPFFPFVETAVADQIVQGYQCGGPGEPCDSENRPYFRPYSDVTRGQLSKIVVIGAEWAQVNPATNSFEDVLPTNTFYTYIETSVCHAVISGYQCGGPGEPCDSEYRPYFRPNNNALRGQIAKIVYLALTNPPNNCAEGQ